MPVYLISAPDTSTVASSSPEDHGFDLLAICRKIREVKARWLGIPNRLIRFGLWPSLVERLVREIMTCAPDYPSLPRLMPRKRTSNQINQTIPKYAYLIRAGGRFGGKWPNERIRGQASTTVFENHLALLSSLLVQSARLPENR
jgi:hypothetical protein